MRIVRAILRKVGRTAALLFLAAMGTILFVRLAPGYFDDVREMDAKYAQGERAELNAEQMGQASVWATAFHSLGGLLRGDLGESRQYEIPVSNLIRQRIQVTASLLAHGIAYGWLLAFCAALPLSAVRKGSTLLGAPFTLLLAIPTGALATLCLLSNRGGPSLVLALVLAARDFKFLERMFRTAWKAPHLLHARAQGLRLHQLVRRHVLPNVLSSLLALTTLSLVTALSAIVPIEVCFDVPGVGQLAWTAAMNRDLPVLLAVTMLMAVAITCATSISQQLRPLETA
jgi:peptide/nickel transport system permease protein